MVSLSTHKLYVRSGAIVNSMTGSTPISNKISSSQRYLSHQTLARECIGSVVECLTRDRSATGSSLIGVTALCP